MEAGETNALKWQVDYPSEEIMAMCIALRKEGGRLLLSEPAFRQKFPQVAGAADDGDRWILGIRKVAVIGKARITTRSPNRQGDGLSECGDIRDFPAASQVLCQMARTGC